MYKHLNCFLFYTEYNVAAAIHKYSTVYDICYVVLANHEWYTSFMRVCSEQHESSSAVASLDVQHNSVCCNKLTNL